MRLCPGIYFGDEPAGREAKIIGTGLGVWEVVRDYLAAERNLNRLRRSLPHVSSAQVDAAARYYAAWTDEIDQLIAANEHAAGAR